MAEAACASLHWNQLNCLIAPCTSLYPEHRNSRHLFASSEVGGNAVATNHSDSEFTTLCVPKLASEQDYEQVPLEVVPKSHTCGNANNEIP
eukprot:2454097-Amphidinium_carterae.1